MLADGATRSTQCYSAAMATEISQRELRNDSGRIMRSLGDGETFTITSNGEPVGELTPLHRRRFVSAAAVIDTFHAAPPIDADRFRRDLDELANQEIEPRG